MSAIRIDSHQHFWKYDPVRDAWITDDMKVIQKDFLPEDLSAHLIDNQIDGCVAVQADQSEHETHFLLELSKQHSFIKGVVGWLDFQSPQLEEKLEYWTQFKKLKGFRHIVQAEPVGFLNQSSFSRGIALLKTFKYTYDILIYPHQCTDAIEFLRSHPDQSFVIDHLAKPSIVKGEIKDWARNIRELAHYPYVMCKLSGMVTEADWINWSEDDFKPYMEVIVDCFGTDRVMYGSDWPVCLLAATYDQQLGIVEKFIATFSEAQKQQIMGGNATRFYNL